MGHEHKLEFPEVPNFRIYKVEDVPELMNTQKRLAKLGLHDPWLRNEVWKYQLLPRGRTTGQDILRGIFSGSKYGLGIAIIMTIISKTFARKVEHH